MKNSVKSLLGTFGLLLVTFIPVMNAQDCGCGAALAKDKIESSDEGFEYLHSLSEITESEYDKIKKSGDGGFKYKIISGSANYSDFKEKVRTEIHKTELETGRQYKSSRYEARTSPIAYEAWGKCMESCNKIGLLLWIQNESKSSLALMLKYRPAPNSNATISYTVTIQHGDGSVDTKTGTIVPNGSEPITVKRKCGSTYEISQTTISVKGAGYSSDWVSSKFYCGTPPPPTPIVVKPDACTGQNFDPCKGMWVCSDKPLPAGCVINDTKNCPTCQCNSQWFIKNISNMGSGSEGWVCEISPIPSGWEEIPNSLKECTCCPSDGKGRQKRIRKL